MTEEPTTRTWVRRGLEMALATEEDTSARSVGELELAPFQARAVRRGSQIVRRFGGVVIADAVGLGKTRVALGIVERLRRESRLRATSPAPTLVCVPARLRAQWRRKLEAAGLDRHRVLSHTAMSRGGVDELDRTPGTVLVDEAHRFRNPTANRSRALADLCAESPVVLATATPVCNSIWDLHHLLALFLAEHDLRRRIGVDLTDAFERAECGEFDLTELVEEVVIRRVTPPSRGRFGERPTAKLEVLRYEAEASESWVWQNLEHRLRDLEFAAFGDEWPRELFIEYTLRRWESGPEALQETLEELAEYHRRWLEAHRHGRSLDRSQFRSLFEAASDRRQEVFPFLFAEGEPATTETSGDPEAVRRDRRVLEELENRVGRVVERHYGPAARIAELAASLDERMLIFTRYRRAAGGLFDALRERLGSRGRLAMVTGDRAVATGLGRCSMDEILRRFAPQSYAGRELPEHQQIRVLVGTDCLSEGVNLQDCGHVVLADLPYSALVVEQRIGRLVRPGSPHAMVRVYLPRPENWSDTLGLRRRLQRKLAEAERSGAGFAATGRELIESAFDSPEESLREAAGAGRGRASVSRSVGGAEGEGVSVRQVGPARIGIPDEGTAPLASMTKLDALRHRLGSADQMLERAWWRAEAPVEEPCLWLAVERTRGTETSLRWLLIRPGEEVEYRRAHLVRPLVALADADLRLESAEPPAELLEQGEKWVEGRRAKLRAVMLAPVPLSWSAPQYDLWRTICSWVERGRLDVAPSALEALRGRVLRPFPRGAERQFDRLHEADLPPRRVYRAVRRIAEMFEPIDAGLEIAIRSGVHLLPRPP